MPFKKLIPLLLFLVFLSLLSGYLMSRASLAGRIGIDLFYKQYQFLKVWWQGALLVFLFLLAVLIVQFIIRQKLKTSSANLVFVFILLIGIVGFAFTWYDFRNTASHRLLGDRFHMGAYLVWLGWAVTSVFFLVVPSKKSMAS